MNPKRNLWLWSLYDFANSIVLMAFLFYFSQWLVIDQGKPAWWYNIALVASSALFIITAPYISKKIDATNLKLGGLRFWTALTFIGYLMVALLTVLTNDIEFLVTVIYTLSTYAYLVCFLYFTPMLSDLATTSDRSWKSGIGQGANSIGQVVGVLVTLPFVNGLTLFGDPGRAQALLPATIIFGVLALPMLLFYRESKKVPSSDTGAVRTTSNLVTLFKEVFSHRALALLFLAYFLFSDALLTFANNFPLYLETVHYATDTVKSVLTASILILAAIGAVVFGKIADKKGNLKTLKVILVIWCFILVAMALVGNFKLLVPIFLFAGIFYGPVWAISRALVAELAPPHLTASSYSYYVVAERFATLVGPLVWSIALVTMGEGVRGYQAGLLSLTVLVVVGLFVLRKIPVSRGAG
ncbi:MAG TPA: MFS transporter [Candidatus Paceibacterota bacterium]